VLNGRDDHVGSGEGWWSPEVERPGARRCNVRVAAADEHRPDSLKLRLVERDATRILSTYRVGHRAGYRFPPALYLIPVALDHLAPNVPAFRGCGPLVFVVYLNRRLRHPAPSTLRNKSGVGHPGAQQGPKIGLAVGPRPDPHDSSGLLDRLRQPADGAPYKKQLSTMFAGSLLLSTSLGLMSDAFKALATWSMRVFL
jgi:hypothetical protein